MLLFVFAWRHYEFSMYWILNRAWVYTFVSSQSAQNIYHILACIDICCIHLAVIQYIYYDTLYTKSSHSVQLHSCFWKNLYHAKEIYQWEQFNLKIKWLWKGIVIPDRQGSHYVRTFCMNTMYKNTFRSSSNVNCVSLLGRM